MKTLSRWALLGSLLVLTVPVHAAKKGKKAAAAEKSAQDAAMMAQWTAFATPGEAHRALDLMVGSWDHEVRCWMAPGTEPMKSTGTNTSQWILGGRFLEQRAQGFFMGQPFEGLGHIGYDNAQKFYVSSWMDNMGTGVMKSTGTYDSAARAWTETGVMPDPMSPTGTKAFRGVTKFVSNDEYTYEVYTAGPDGKEFRMMELIYRRKK